MNKEGNKKFFLLLQTVRYLQLKQILYQSLNRLKPAKSLTAFITKNIKFGEIHSTITCVSPNVENDLTFNFLNQVKRFSGTVDWNFMEYGKLWNYNLQYFEFLNQSDLDIALKITLLKDIGLCLRKGTLKLEPYPVSLRIINSIVFCSNNNIHDNQIIKDIHAQLIYLNKNLEYHLLGNHLLENGFALLMGSYAFGEKTLLKKSKKLLHEQLNEQILKDGGHFELSPMYHQIILFRVLQLIEWYNESKNHDEQFLIFLKKIALDMLGWLKAITFSNGDVPQLNDTATGIALTSKELFDSAKRIGFKEILSSLLNDSGYRKFSFGKYECVADVGIIGPSYQPGHGHADALSYIIYFENQPFLVEAGTSTYQINEKRFYERSTSAHNTVVVEGENQSEVWSAFRVGRRANVKVEYESVSNLTASHNGYIHNFGIIHQRHFTFGMDTITIIDQIGKVAGKAFLHFHPERIIKLKPNNIVTIDNMAEISFKGAKNIKEEMYDYADGFNTYKQGSQLIIDFTNKLETVIKFF